MYHFFSKESLNFMFFSLLITITAKINMESGRKEKKEIGRGGGEGIKTSVV